MVFKGNIDYLNENEICIRLRATQQNSSVLPSDSLYAIEHDAMDTTFRSMYQGLYAFMSATKDVVICCSLNGSRNLMWHWISR